jgi:uncharacterized phage protein (TIGR01671 family)
MNNVREYKFRGKRIDNGEWVYGYYFIEERDIEDGIIWRDIPKIQQRYGDHFQYFDVDPNTVGQYTGWNDENGKEIYEDDLVMVADYASWEGLYKVIWDEENSMYMIEDAYGDREKLCEFEEYLVKGNIYENPELLE